MRRRLIVIALLAAVAMSVASRAAAQKAPKPPANGDCLACHGDADAKRASGSSVAVDAKIFSSSIHGELACVDCHADLRTLQEYPHADRLKPVDCGTCHDQAGEFARSVHAAIAPTAGGLVTCTTCHGPPHAIKPASDPASPTYKLRIAETCARCHSDSIPRGNLRGPAVAGMFADSIHARMLRRTTVAPTCSDCHHAHDIRHKTDVESPVHPSSVAATCGTCHMEQRRLYEQGVHAAALHAGNAGAPECASCHTAHSIRETASADYQLAVVEQCGTCHKEARATYRDGLHGQVTAIGYVPVAKCADCHQPHAIFKPSDARSSVSSVNLVATCQKCHRQANANFAQYQPHANKDDRGRFPSLYYAAQFMNLLLAGVFSFFGVHTLLWFWRERGGPGDGKDVHHG